MPVIGLDDCQFVHSVIDLSDNLSKDTGANYDTKIHSSSQYAV
jgi:hypothetical protein